MKALLIKAFKILVRHRVAFLCLVFFILFYFILSMFDIKRGLLKGALVLLMAILTTASYLLFHFYRRNKMSLSKTLNQTNSWISVFQEEVLKAVKLLKDNYKGCCLLKRRALYALPWYIVLDGGHSDKKFFFKNDGLQLTAVKEYHAIEESPIWLTEEAVLLNVSEHGLYDNEEWMGALNAVRNQRKNLPINGVILVISAETLIMNLENNRDFIKHVRNQINTLYRKFGLIVPTHLLITELRLLYGFNIFFSEETELKEVIQMRITHFGEEGLSINEFKQYQKDLLTSIKRLSIHKIMREQESWRKKQLYVFPNQLKFLFDRIETCINLLTQESAYQKGLKLSGLYLLTETSKSPKNVYATADGLFHYLEQEGALEQVKDNFSMKETWRQIFSSEENYSIKSRRKRTVKGVVNGLMVIFTTIFLVVLLHSALFANKKLLNNGLLASNYLTQSMVSDGNTSVEQIAALLKNYRFYINIDHSQASIPWHKHLGLYRGNDLLSPLSQSMSEIMEYQFLPVVTNRLENKLQQYQKRWAQSNKKQRQAMRGKYYITLKLYLMLNEPKHLETDEASVLLAPYWYRALYSYQKINQDRLEKTNSIKQLSGLIKIYLKWLKSQSANFMLINKPPINNQFVGKIRRQLYTTVDAKNIFSEIQTQLLAQLPVLSLSDLMPANSGLLESNERLPSLYTARMYKKIVSPMISRRLLEVGRGDWVINHNRSNNVLNGHARKKLQKRIKELYYHAYTKAWESFINSIYVVPFSGMKAAAQNIKVLSKPSGPIFSLLRLIDNNMQIPRDDQLNRDNVLPFSVVHKLLQGKSFLLLQRYFHSLSLSQIDIEKLMKSADLSVSAKNYALPLFSHQKSSNALYQAAMVVEGLLNNIDNEGVKKTLRRILLSPIQQTFQTIVNEAAAKASKQWKQGIYPKYEKSIKGHFPFIKVSKEADAFEINNFLQVKQGELWQFMQNYLSPFTQLTSSGWKRKAWLGVGVQFSKKFMKALNQYQLLANAMFNGAQPHFNFQLYPIPSSQITRTTLSIYGRSFSYRNGPQQWCSFLWTGNQNQIARLTVLSRYGAIKERVFSGPWAAFHLFHQAIFIKQENNTYQINWPFIINHHQKVVAKYLLRTDQGINPFYLLATQSFELPEELLQLR